MAAINFLKLLTHIVKHSDSLQCQKVIKMQFGLQSRVGPGNMYYMGCRRPSGKEHFLGLQSIGFWGLGKSVKMGRPTLMICTLYDVFLHKELSFGGSHVPGSEQVLRQR